MRLLFLSVAVIIGVGCQKKIEWQAEFKNAGTYSSPRAVDLNQDQVKDIVVGAGGRQEWEPSENGVLAINGRDGSLLWRKSCRNQMVGSAIFKDLNEDEVPDVLIGGRSAQFMAISGTDGKIIWEYMAHNPAFDFENDTSVLNFFTPQFVSDLDDDGMEDVIVSYGGFVKAPPEVSIRPTGYLMIFSSKTGKVLAKAPMPDGKETYMSPVVLTNDTSSRVFFGTGGETVSGNFYVTDIHDILDDNISEYHTIVTGKNKGFIAPPILIELNQDKVLDIVINGYEGIVCAINGKNYEALWKVDVGSDFETHSQPAVGQLVGDKTPDFFVNFGKGSWPQIERSIQLVIDGKTGKSIVVDSLGNLQYSSPIPVRKENGTEDLILHVINENHATNYAPESGMPQYIYKNMLYQFNVQGEKPILMLENSGTNIGSTLLLEDMDNDQILELIYVYNSTQEDPFLFNGVHIFCKSLPGYSSKWNQYMGASGKSVYLP
ncbi:MAG: outer membrane protein assembly factor BamB family protein [Candidatus Cyclobacteriaceae bacterium M3_2C_046]